MSQKKVGLILSYITLLASSVLAIVLTPFMLRSLGAVEYGLYQSISSFIGVLAVLDFGTGITATKNISELRLRGDKEGESNYLATQMIINVIIAIIILVIGVIFAFSVDTIFQKGFSEGELSKARLLAFLYVINVIVTMFGNTFQGVITGYQKFAVSNAFSLGKILVRFLLIFILLSLGMDSIAISIADIVATSAFTIVCMIYVIPGLKVRILLKKLDMNLFLSTMAFSAALFLQTIVNQINNSIDKVLLGALMGGVAVTLYSVAMSVYLIYGSLSGAVRNIMLPDAVKLINNNATGDEITSFVIKGGRFQFAVLGYILFGFILVGKEFIYLWVGDGYEVSWYITMILMVPTLFQLSTNISETILDAMGKRMIRSVILLTGALFNLAMTIVLVKKMGVIGAPIATAVSSIIFGLVILNIYHKKVMNLNVKRMFIEICSKTTGILVVSFFVAYLSNLLKLSIFIMLLVKGLIFSIVYFGLMIKIGFNAEEKQMVFSRVKR
ncbi:MAG: oligosaccharide flippase family protein [Herbinix sp.]|nr:oligosaccharide flippase family protein [Herbinix sp.]